MDQTWSVHPATTTDKAKELFRHVAANKIDRDTAVALVRRLLGHGDQPSPRPKPGRKARWRTPSVRALPRTADILAGRAR